MQNFYRVICILLFLCSFVSCNSASPEYYPIENLKYYKIDQENKIETPRPHGFTDSLIEVSGEFKNPGPSASKFVFRLGHVYFNAAKLRIIGSESKTEGAFEFGLGKKSTSLLSTDAHSLTISESKKQQQANPATIEILDGYNVIVDSRHFEKDEKILFNMTLSSINTVEIPIKILNLEDYHYWKTENILAIALYAGLILGLLFYSLVVYFVHRDSSFLYYSFVLMSFHLFTNLSQFGIFKGFIYDLSPFLADRQFAYCHFFSVLSMFLFYREFVERKMPNFSKGFHFYLLRICLLLSTFLTIGIHFIYSSVFDNIQQITTTIFVFSMLIFPLINFKFLNARLVAIAWTFPIVAWVFNFLRLREGWFGIENLKFLILIGCGIEALLLSFSVAFRLNSFMKEKDKARLEKIESENELKTFSHIKSLTDEICHDIKRPFSLLKLAIEMFQSLDLPMNSESSKKVDIIRRSLAKALSDAEKLISQLQKGMKGYSLEREPLDIGTLLTDCLQDELSSVKKPPKSQVVIPDKITIEGDKLKLERAFKNILHNALCFADESDQLWIKSSVNKTNYSIEIGNTGSSVPKDKLETIFLPYYSKRKGGSGIGLFVASNYMKLHGGTISCQSDEKENWTAFKFVLPIN